ncbi:MAG: tRNA pseudouridine(55) synthase TruB [Deltaproteobacteria bacterium RBG_16_44_11]|nr:MAG: tRNA pseudouridine(55) synthase TruB [Deltaproteobacteria bacterium RBG_16_44_11]
MNGAVIIDKPEGKTSHDIVSEVKKILGVRKAGHTGTLDPMATGVLTVCLDEATKLTKFLAGEDKEYLATMLLGVKTDTLDSKGKVIATSDKFVSEKEIRAVITQMKGKIKQIPPAYSAIKYHGEPLYKWARRGILIDKEPREVEINSIMIEDISLPRVTFRVDCSKGTYIRTLCSDIGERLGCGACLCGLRRLRSGFFSEEMAVSLSNHGNYTYKDKKNELLEKILPMAKLMPLMIAIEVEVNFAAKLRHGTQPSVEMMKEYVLPFLAAGDMIKLISREGDLVALAEMVVPVSKFPEFDSKDQAAKIVRVFNNIYN